jgi:hypothetical protein
MHNHITYISSLQDLLTLTNTPFFNTTANRSSCASHSAIPIYHAATENTVYTSTSCFITLMLSFSLSITPSVFPHPIQGRLAQRQRTKSLLEQEVSATPVTAALSLEVPCSIHRLTNPFSFLQVWWRRAGGVSLFGWMEKGNMYAVSEVVGCWGEADEEGVGVRSGEYGCGP